MVAQHDCVVQDSFGADGIWDTVVAWSPPDDELAPGHRATLDELEDPGEASRTPRQSYGTPYADMAASRDSADSASVSGQHTPAGAGIAVQSAHQGLHDPTASLHLANPDPAVTVDGDNEPAHVTSRPRATRAGSLNGNASGLDAGSTKIPTVISEVATIAVFNLTDKPPEGKTLNPCEQTGAQRILSSTVNQGSDSPQPSVTPSLGPNHEKGHPALIPTLESGERESTAVRSPNSQAPHPPTADSLASAGIHTRPMNSDDSSTDGPLTDQPRTHLRRKCDERDVGITIDMATEAPIRSTGASQKSSAAESQGCPADVECHSGMVKEGNTKSIDKCEGGIAIDTVVIPSTRSTEASPESSRAGSQGCPIDIDSLSGEMEETDARSSSPQHSDSDLTVNHSLGSKAGQDQKRKRPGPDQHADPSPKKILRRSHRSQRRPSYVIYTDKRIREEFAKLSEKASEIGSQFETRIAQMEVEFVDKLVKIEESRVDLQRRLRDHAMLID